MKFNKKKLKHNQQVAKQLSQPRIKRTFAQQIAYKRYRDEQIKKGEPYDKTKFGVVVQDHSYLSK